MSDTESTSLVSGSSTSGESSNSASYGNVCDNSGIKNKKLDSLTENVSNDSRESKSNSSKGRVVQSKYRTAALAIAKKGKCLEGSSVLSLSRSNSSDSKCNDKSSKMVDKKCLQRKGLFTAESNASRFSRPPPKILLQDSQNKKLPNKPNPTLHSTAVYNSTFFDKTVIASSDMFSTTVVGGHKLGHQQLQRNCPLLSELSDISTISPINVTPPVSEYGNLAGAGAALATIPNENVVTKITEMSSDYNEDKIIAEYLRYLTWALVDINSEDKYRLQMAESEKQILFLISVIEEQQNSLLEEKKSLALINHYNEISKVNEAVKESLQNLNASVEPCANSLEVLTSNLEERLSKIRLNNLHIPTDQKAFENELTTVLQENLDLISKINTYMDPGRARHESLAELTSNINNCIDNAKPCLSELEQLASAIIQETSLRFTLDKVNENLLKNGK